MKRQKGAGISTVCLDKNGNTVNHFTPYGKDAPPPPDPAELARTILGQMKLTPPRIHMTPKPGRTGLVGMPVWLWVDKDAHGFGPQSKSTSLRGVTVTVKAQVDHVTWVMGDGGLVTCHNAGTPYSPAYKGKASPTCGYRFSETSAGQPHGAFSVKATAQWSITWQGGGQEGQIPMALSSSTSARIGEAQVLG